MWFVFPTPAVPVGEYETPQAKICVGMSSMYVIQAQLTLTPTLTFLFMSYASVPLYCSYDNQLRIEYQVQCKSDELALFNMTDLDIQGPEDCEDHMGNNR